MRLVVAGGTGFLGHPLCEVYAEEGHELLILTRSVPPGASKHEPGTGIPGITKIGWMPNGDAGSWACLIDGAHAVVNLAGESIAGRRWSEDQKDRIRSSRLHATRSLAAAIAAAERPPRVFVSGSATGYYGPRGPEPLTEQAPPGTDFLAALCVEWEQAAHNAARPETRIVTVRTGIVLDREGGALQKMVTPFRMFAGGPLGSGSQYMSWIHRADWIEMVRWIVETEQAAGPINGTGPEPVTNAEFSKALGRALGRPSWLPAPAFALRVALGEMADALLLTGQRVVPKRALDLGYHFRFPEIAGALRDIFDRD
ncbi:MAG: TIGR01777 family oxidoreductase [Acidobacteria bacterium]|nr:TIGR01777 family oxidoreductase [Acidobacteriota bacterium]